MNEKFKRIRKLLNERDAMNEQIYDEAREVFPKGIIVQFQKWGKDITAEILDTSGHGSYPRFYVRSHTGKEYWVDLYYLIESVAD